MPLAPPEHRAPPRQRGLSPWAIAALFFLSGACALGYEVVWSRQLRYVLGSTTSGIAYVVALFMGGMALGYTLGGRLSRWIRRPIVAYGVLEILLAALSLLAVGLLPRLEALGGGVAAYLISAALILPATILAGATLPLLVEATRGGLGEVLGRLYAANTAGAFLGVAATGLVLIGELGLWRTATCIAGVQLAVGAIAIAGGFPAGRATGAPPDGRQVAQRGQTAAVWLFLAFAAGASSLAEEVLWTRALVTHLNASTYAFSLILAVFLLGLTAGAAAAAWLLRRGVNSARWLVATQIAVGLLVVGSPELLRLAEQLVPGYVGVRQVTGFAGWLGTLGLTLVRTMAALLPACFLLGFALPLITERFRTAPRSRGERVGFVAGWNTAGAVLGALAAHFLLLPTVGLSGSLRIAALLHATIALVACRAIDRRGWRSIALALALALVLVAALRPGAVPYLGRLADKQRTLLIHEGVQDTTAVVEHTSGPLKGYRTIIANGISYAGDAPGSLQYMRLLGHLPALFAREQRHALVICIGTGNTAGAVAAHRAFSRFDLVDISSSVALTMPLFARTNQRVWQDPRVKIHLEDGRVFLARAAPAVYDVITLEPPPPRVAGVGSLYSREFYRSARRVLKPGGALAQWLPIHGLTGGELNILTRTFLEVFPEGRLIMLHPAEAALIGTKGEGADRGVWQQRLLQPAVARQLAEIEISDPSRLPQRHGTGLRRRIGPGPILSDDLPLVEYFAARLPWHGTAEANQRRRFLGTIFGE